MDEETKERIKHLKIGSWTGIALFFAGFVMAVLNGVSPELLLMNIGFFVVFICLTGSVQADLKFRIGVEDG